MQKSLLSIILYISALSCCVAQTTIPLKKGQIQRVESFHSKFVSSRKVDIWLPESYGTDTSKRYAVIYMHDGQNLFIPKTAYGGVEWQVDETVSSLTKDKRMVDCIVVGIWNTSKRMREYQPSKPFKLMDGEIEKRLTAEYHGSPLGDEYLKFITKELKPFIDKRYNTYTDNSHTTIIGSSMGALISLYAICEYPEVFGKAACMSTHWPVSLKENNPAIGKAYVSYLEENLPSNKDHKIYFDYGTKTLDSLYTPYQTEIDKVMHKKWPSGNWTTIKYVEDEHRELFWQRRFSTPLEYLLGI